MLRTPVVALQHSSVIDTTQQRLAIWIDQLKALAVQALDAIAASRSTQLHRLKVRAESLDFQLESRFTAPVILRDRVGHIDHLAEHGLLRPAPDNGLTLHAVLLELQSQMPPSQKLLMTDPATTRPEQWLRMSSPERFEFLQVMPERMIDLIKLQQCFRLHQQIRTSCFKPISGQDVECLMKCTDLSDLNGETTGGGMSTMPIQQCAALLQRTINCKTFRCAD